MEDDYVPIINNFDDKMIEILESRPHCGYVCQYFTDRPILAGGNICKGEAVRDILVKGLQLKYPANDGQGLLETCGKNESEQLGFVTNLGQGDDASRKQ